MIGLVKGVAFGVVVALTGCYYGMRCGRSAAAVGEATTRAVVMGIVLVVVVDAVFTVLLHAAAPLGHEPSPRPTSRSAA